MYFLKKKWLFRRDFSREYPFFLQKVQFGDNHIFILHFNKLILHFVTGGNVFFAPPAFRRPKSTRRQSESDSQIFLRTRHLRRGEVGRSKFIGFQDGRTHGRADVFFGKCVFVNPSPPLKSVGTEVEENDHALCRGRAGSSFSSMWPGARNRTRAEAKTIKRSNRSAIR